MQYLFLPNKGSHYQIKEIKRFTEKMLRLYFILSIFIISLHKRIYHLIYRRTESFKTYYLFLVLNSIHLCKQKIFFVKHIYIQDISFKNFQCSCY